MLVPVSSMVNLALDARDSSRELMREIHQILILERAKNESLLGVD